MRTSKYPYATITVRLHGKASRAGGQRLKGKALAVGF